MASTTGIKGELQQISSDVYETVLKYKTYVLKVSLYCKGCVKHVTKILKTIEGVYITQVDFAHRTITVHGNVEAETLIKVLRKKTKKHVEVLWPERKANPKDVRQSNPKSKEEQSGSVETSKEAKENQGRGDEERKGKQPMKAETDEVNESESSGKKIFEAGSCSYKVEEVCVGRPHEGGGGKLKESPPVVAESEIVGAKAGGVDGSPNEKLHHFAPVHQLHYRAVLPSASYAKPAHCQPPTYVHWGVVNEVGWSRNDIPPLLPIQDPQPPQPYPPHLYNSSVSADTFAFFSDENTEGCSVILGVVFVFFRFGDKSSILRFLLAFHTINAPRSAYQSITFKPDFFDVYNVAGDLVQCSVLLKAVCAVLRTPIGSIDHLSVNLPDAAASKVQWTLECYNDRSSIIGNVFSQHHPSNWVDADEDDNEEDGDEDEMCIQSTPPYYEEH